MIYIYFVHNNEEKEDSLFFSKIKEISRPNYDLLGLLLWTKSKFFSFEESHRLGERGVKNYFSIYNLCYEIKEENCNFVFFTLIGIQFETKR